jgi:hypothetical protein
VVRETQE